MYHIIVLMSRSLKIKDSSSRVAKIVRAEMRKHVKKKLMKSPSILALDKDDNIVGKCNNMRN